MGGRSTRKGKRYEREFCRRATEATGAKHERVLDESREGNHRGDVAADGLPLTYQLKAQKQPSVYRALDEAIEAAPDGFHPVAIVKRDYGPGRTPHEFAAIPLDNWLEIVGLLTEAGAW